MNAAEGSRGAAPQPENQRARGQGVSEDLTNTVDPQDVTLG
ncbi:MAG TPA: hypothetical protein VFK29_05140 [Rhodanobacteraceae bacterium]|jgi:hypothetical protein|nr:hypothetical protein [Rhodanobacteraceae bacterium]